MKGHLLFLLLLPSYLFAQNKPKIISADTALVFSYDMIAVEGGCFKMGCIPDRDGECQKDELLHEVCLSDFMIGKYEVTQAQWTAVMGANPSAFQSPPCPDCPVEQVRWDKIQEFLKKINEKTGLNYRLPTEAEWEFAARGGNKTKGYKHSGSNNPELVAWHKSNSKRKTHLVGQKEPNELGLYDMSGNVWEWCADATTSYAEGPAQNPIELARDGASRRLRGGSWSNNESYARLSNRLSDSPTNEYYSFGFRLSLVP